MKLIVWFLQEKENVNNNYKFIIQFSLFLLWIMNVLSNFLWKRLSYHKYLFTTLNIYSIVYDFYRNEIILIFKIISKVYENVKE